MRGKLRNITLSVLIITLIASSLAASVFAFAEDRSYFVCFSNQNYAVRNANRMQETEGGYILKNISLSSAVDFYITDNSGSRWYASDDKPMTVEETAVYSYDILFSPEEVFGQTGCRINYRFYEPAEYSLEIGGEEVSLTYNPYHTAYELYCISSIELAAGTEVRYGEEVHTAEQSGFYRILFTPVKTTNGSLYAFDENGVYGSGDGFTYSVYIEDAPQYFATFENVKVFSEEDARINGNPAYALTRYEKNVAAAEYRSAEIFAPERDFGVRYRVYEKSADGSFRLIDDDNNEDTDISKLNAVDCGRYALSFTDGGTVFRSALEWEDKNFGGWYAVGWADNCGFDAEGNIDLYDEYKFTEVEDGDDDYDEDYKQYILYLTVTEKQLRDEDFEFFITDGETKFKDGTEYIKITIAGRYKILCSEEHNYGIGRNFRYILEDENKDGAELNIGTAAEFVKFAENCAKSADYSVNLKVYLTADIDFKGVEFVSAGTFSGTLYGGYHKLKNITSENNVFEVLAHTATVERLTVENADFGGKDAENAGFIGTNYGTVKFVAVSGKVTGKNYVGGIAAVNGRSDTQTGDSGDSVNRALITGCESSAEVYGERFVGGICGRNTGDITSCKSSGGVYGSKSRSSATASEIGGIAGYSYGKIYGCNNFGKVAGGESSAYAGGIIGLCVGEVYYCVNEGNISADRYAGGIVGYYGLRPSENSSIDGIISSGNNETEPIGSKNILNYLLNKGDITANSYAGGILGDAASLTGGNAPARTLRLRNAVSSATVRAEAGSYAGGIAGNSSGAEIVSCSSSGTVEAKGTGGGNYAGGIAGYGSAITYCMSSVTVKGAGYVGGIAGYAASALTGCYTNTLLLPTSEAENVGEIAGYAAGFSAAQNTFTGVEANYYIGDCGGINGREYAGEYNFAAARVASETLASAGALSPELGEKFSREFWQGGNGSFSYPLLRNFEEAEECTEFDNDELFGKLFTEYSARFKALSEDNAKLTYTVTFMEWNEDNGDLYDEGELQTDNFDIIASVRVAHGKTVEIPALQYAQDNGKGQFVAEGDGARYFVSFPAVGEVKGNTTVYAVYRELITSVTNDGNTVFAEGEFIKGTTVNLVSVGEYRALEFILDGKPVTADTVTVKYYAGENAGNYTVYGADGEKIKSEVSGGFLSFEYKCGSYFKVEQNAKGVMPFWAWLLIGMGSAAAVAGAAVAVVVIVKKRKSALSVAK